MKFWLVYMLITLLSVQQLTDIRSYSMQDIKEKTFSNWENRVSFLFVKVFAILQTFPIYFKVLLYI